MWRTIQGENACANDEKKLNNIMQMEQRMIPWLGVIIDDQELALLANRSK